MSVVLSWDAAAVLQVGDDLTPVLRLDTEERVTIGRSERAGLRSPSVNRYMPRELATLNWTRFGWFIRNGRRTVGSTEARVRIAGPFIDEPNGALFAPNALVLLQRGEWTLEWELEVRTVLRLTPIAEPSLSLPVARDRPEPVGPQAGRTALARPDIALTPTQRERMGALFAYLIAGTATPPNRYQAAGELLGQDDSRIKSTAQNVIRSINANRRLAAGIKGLDELGHYLVEVAKLIGPGDVPRV
ncbi:hypothetical protein [Luteimicrobium subarcticum]|uniref:Uncharacterized protein n=1 Tax=Luteimicrobium subarcticum TaxID=620910 RepID=A0A2M8WRL8_9MICO|nr:hypothetical protein [Luteimicrobium subarcticum]PJI93572.1 hypothetical protein CLV34_2148 [Luteimicrobium subarcticum]